MESRTTIRRRLLLGGILFGAVLAGSGLATAHGGTAGGTRNAVTAPPWLVVATGGGVIGGSFLLSSFATDRTFVQSLHERSWSLPVTSAVYQPVGTVLGALLFGTVVATGFLISGRGTGHPAVIIVWIGWWSGYTMSTYLFGNSWPMLNPFRLSEWLDTGRHEYPSRLGCWPAVLGLFGIVWLESVSPIAETPHLLGTVVLAYGLVSVAGVTWFGPDTWLEKADPVSKFFHYYGVLAPVGWTDSGLELRLPGSRLPELRVDGLDEVGFLVAMLWVTTFDGLAHTQFWSSVVEFAAERGLPTVVVQAGGLLIGYAVFYGAFRAATVRIRSDAPTPLPSVELARRFAPSLVPIAAGYHFAHFAGYFISGVPLLGAAFAPPLFMPVAADPLTVPAWLSGLRIAGILVGHLVGVWIAHSIALELFPGRMQAIRSQYAPVTVMVGYTILGLWIITQPTPTN